MPTLEEYKSNIVQISQMTFELQHAIKNAEDEWDMPGIISVYDELKRCLVKNREILSHLINPQNHN
jgi:hypothetical protein